MKELSRKIETIKGLEMALRNATWGIESMALVNEGQSEHIKVDFVDGCYPTYYINITGSSPQGIFLDVARFIERKAYKR